MILHQSIVTVVKQSQFKFLKHLALIYHFLIVNVHVKKIIHPVHFFIDLFAPCAKS